MAGHGPPPAEQRRRTNVPVRGEWQPSQATGWQHGAIPPCPVRAKAAMETWDAWMRAWFAAHWDPSDLPNLRLLIGLWAKVNAGDANREQNTMYLRLANDLGITREGQADRRWLPPVAQDANERPAHLRVVGSRRDA